MSIIPLEVENDMVLRLGETGLDDLVGDPEADTLGGEPGGVSLGVLVWDASSIDIDTPGLDAANNRNQITLVGEIVASH